MKLLTKVIAVTGLIFLTSGCSATGQSQLSGMSGGACNNGKCQCPKPCQCGAGCKCGMGGNTNNMNGSK